MLCAGVFFSAHKVYSQSQYSQSWPDQLTVFSTEVSPRTFFQAWWSRKIAEKMRNTRKRRDRNIPCVVSNREKRAALLTCQTNDEGIKRSKTSPAFGLPNYLPSKPVTEDAASTMKHIELLKKEKEKSHMNSKLVDQSMKLTFYNRRHLIVKEGHSIVALKDQYPCLFDCHQVKYLPRYIKKITTESKVTIITICTLIIV